ncbi:MAG TPA: hypothetical protein VIS96_11360 [Terrimicrobiaceae bacterium]
MGLIEVTSLHNRELVHGLEGKSVHETFSDISRDTTLSHAYLDKLKSIYTSPTYQDSVEAHPLREKELKKGNRARSLRTIQYQRSRANQRIQRVAS